MIAMFILSYKNGFHFYLPLYHFLKYNKKNFLLLQSVRGERKSYVHFETENDSLVIFKLTKKTLIYDTRGGQHNNQTHLN